MNQLINRLERALAAASDPIEVAELEARIAGNFARVGRFEEASRKIAWIRQRFGAGQSGRVIVWVMLAEGLLEYYRNLTPLALDRITRAQQLSMAMKYQSFVAIASAWKAHIEFETSQYGAMIGSLQTAMSNAVESDHDAQARISMVLANAFMLCGQKAQAQPWFLRGHDHASRNGDQASIEALLYNRAAFGFSWLRAKSCTEALEQEELQALQSEVQSTKNLQNLTGISALDHHILLVEAGLLLLQHEYSRARDALNAVRTRSPFANYNFSQSLIDLQIAFCDFGMSGGLPKTVLIDFSHFERFDVDERMFAAWMIVQMFPAEQEFVSRFASLRHEYEDMCSGLRHSLAVLTSS